MASMPGSLCELLELLRRDHLGAVDGPALEVLHHGVGVGVVLEDDLVDGRLLAPVGGVADQLHVVVLLELDGLERARADDRHRVAEGAFHGLGVELAPDVLRQDVDVHLREQHVGLGRGAVDLERGVVDGDGLLDVLEVDGQAHVVVDDGIEGEGDVARRERLAVLPLDARADVEGPRLLVGRELPVLGEPGLLGRQAVGAHGDERVVVEQPDLVGRAVADERVEVERALVPAEAQRDVVGVRRRRAAARRRRTTPPPPGRPGRRRR